MNPILAYFHTIAPVESENFWRVSGSCLANAFNRVVDRSLRKCAPGCAADTSYEEASKHSTALVKRLQQEREERKKRIEEQRHREEQQLKEKEEERLAMLKEIEGKKEENKVRRLEYMRQQSSIRKEQMEYQKNLLRNNPHTDPLYKKIEKEFVQAFEMPELQRRKEELAKKRLMFAPMKKEEMNSHIKSYNDLRTQRLNKEREKSELAIPQKRFNQLIAIEKGRHKEKEKEEKTKRDRLERRKVFGRQATMSYKPKKSLMKQLEVEIQMRKDELPAALHTRKLATKSASLKPKIRRKKKKPVPQPPPKPKPKVTDYLAERRIARKKEEESILKKHYSERVTTNNHFDSQTKRPVDPESEAKRKEAIIKRMDNNPFSLSMLDAEDEINNLYIESIKSKLEALNSYK